MAVCVDASRDVPGEIDGWHLVACVEDVSAAWCQWVNRGNLLNLGHG